MVSPPSFCHQASSESHYNRQFWFTKFSIRHTSQKEMVFTGLIDSGSNCNLISAGILPDDFLALIRRPTASIKGVGGDRDAIGEFYAQVRINQSTFDHVRFIVVESLTCPTIIGLPIWDHPSVENVLFNHKSNKIVLNRTSGNSEIVEF